MIKILEIMFYMLSGIAITFMALIGGVFVGFGDLGLISIVIAGGFLTTKTILSFFE